MKNTKLKVIDAMKAETGSIELPIQFSEALRPDIIKRAVHAIEANTRQPYGSDPEAGKKASAKVSRRRRDYRGSYGHGISRVPRKVLSVRGTRFNWVGANAPGMRKGRRAHPPKAEKIWDKKINIKEKRKAIRSAMSATIVPELVEKRGHILPAGYPFIIDSSFEKLSKTKDVIKALSALGLDSELTRSSTRTIRAGRGTMRGRRYKSKKGPLVVVSDKCELFDAAKNIPGVDVKIVSRINASVLAPGTDYGRLTLWTKAAIEKIEKEKLFM
jgi:large subunit ribosomal protein L4e